MSCFVDQDLVIECSGLRENKQGSDIATGLNASSGLAGGSRLPDISASASDGLLFMPSGFENKQTGPVCSHEPGAPLDGDGTECRAAEERDGLDLRLDYRKHCWLNAPIHPKDENSGIIYSP